MDVYITANRQRARESLLENFDVEPMPEQDPFLLLISHLLADETGSLLEPSTHAISEDMWISWNQWVLLRETELLDFLAEHLEKEMTLLPTNLGHQRFWAETLVIETLDHLAAL